MFSCINVIGSKVQNVSDYLQGGAVEYYSKGGGKVFEITPPQIENIIRENNLQTDEDKLAFFRGRKRMGMDMTISMSKDISVLAMMFDESVKDIIRDEIRNTLHIINDNYVYTRKRIGDDERVYEKGKAYMSVYEHHTSRELDPQLHFHCFISNQVVRESDGKLSALSNEQILKNINTIRIETYYRMMTKLHEKGYDAYLDKQGNLRVMADDTIVELFSSRKEKILKMAKERYGVSDLSKLSRDQVKELVLATRPSKVNKDIEVLEAMWEQTLIEHGITEAGFLESIKHNRKSQMTEAEIKKAFEIVLRYRDEKDGIFERKKLYQDFLRTISDISKENQTLPPSLDVAREQFEKLIDEYRLVKMSDEENEYLATEQYIETEQKALNVAKSMMKEKAPEWFTKLDIENHRIAFEKEKGFQLSADQSNVLGILQNSKLSTINGHAGAGKTTAIEVLRKACDHHNIKIYGLAPSGKAAEELSKSTGHGQTIDSFLLEVKKLSDDELKKRYGKSVVVVDEVGMVDVRKMNELLNILNKVDCKVVFQGDWKQIKAVDAGDFLHDLVEEAKQDEELKKAYAELTSIRRQKKEEYLRITQALSDFDFQSAFGIMLDNRDKYFADLDMEAVQNDFLQDPRNSLIVCSTNNAKDELNTAIRQKLFGDKLINKIVVNTTNSFEIRHIDDLKEGDKLTIDNKKWNIQSIDRRTNKITLTDGKNIKEVHLSDIIGKQAVREQTKDFTIGERVMATKNDKRLGVKNGEIFYVKSLLYENGKQKLVLVNDQKEVKVDVEQYRYLDHAYAITCHKSQGMTIDRVLIVDTTHDLNQNLFYVAMTRGKQEARIYTDNIVATLSSAQVEQKKLSSGQFQRKKQKNPRKLKASDIAEKIILEAPKEKQEELLKRYGKYLDNYRDVRNKITDKNIEQKIQQQKAERKDDHTGAPPPAERPKDEKPVNQKPVITSPAVNMDTRPPAQQPSQIQTQKKETPPPPPTLQPSQRPVSHQPVISNQSVKSQQAQQQIQQPKQQTSKKVPDQNKQQQLKQEKPVAKPDQTIDKLKAQQEQLQKLLAQRNSRIQEKFREVRNELANWGQRQNQNQNIQRQQKQQLNNIQRQNNIRAKEEAESKGVVAENALEADAIKEALKEERKAEKQAQKEERQYIKQEIKTKQDEIRKEQQKAEAQYKNKIVKYGKTIREAYERMKSQNRDEIAEQEINMLIEAGMGKGM